MGAPTDCAPGTWTAPGGLGGGGGLPLAADHTLFLGKESERTGLTPWLTCKACAPSPLQLLFGFRTASRFFWGEGTQQASGSDPPRGGPAPHSRCPALCTGSPGVPRPHLGGQQDLDCEGWGVQLPAPPLGHIPLCRPWPPSTSHGDALLLGLFAIFLDLLRATGETVKESSLAPLQRSGQAPSFPCSSQPSAVPAELRAPRQKGTRAGRPPPLHYPPGSA